MLTTMEAHPTEPLDIPQRSRLLVLTGLPLVYILMGLLTTPSFQQLRQGLNAILFHPSRIDFDAFYWAGDLGSPFVQAGITLLFVPLLYKIIGTPIYGTELAAYAMVAGFTFYGKNIFSFWFPVAGVLVCARLQGKPLSNVGSLAVFSTSACPLFSYFAFGTDILGFATPLSLTVGSLAAFSAGLLVGLMADYGPRLHRGMLLYNASVAAGWATILLAALARGLGFPINDPQYLVSQYATQINKPVAYMLAVAFGYLIVVGLLMRGAPHYPALFRHASRGEEAVYPFGFAASMIHIGVIGLIIMSYVLLIGGSLGGPALAVIWTVAGFSVGGSSPRTHVPIMVGAVLGVLLTGGVSNLLVGGSFTAGAMTKLASRGAIFAVLFTCGAAPITAKFGTPAAMLVGFIQSLLVSNIPPLHGWLFLYNNGLSLVFVTIFLRPLYAQFFPLERDFEL